MNRSKEHKRLGKLRTTATVLAAGTAALLGTGCDTPSAQRAALAETEAVEAMRNGEAGFGVADMTITVRGGAKFHTYPSQDWEGENGDRSGNIAFTVPEGFQMKLVQPFVYEDGDNRFYAVMDPRIPKNNKSANHADLVWIDSDLIGQTRADGTEYASMETGELYDPQAPLKGATYNKHGYFIEGGAVAIGLVEVVDGMSTSAV